MLGSPLSPSSSSSVRTRLADRRQLHDRARTKAKVWASCLVLRFAFVLEGCDRIGQRLHQFLLFPNNRISFIGPTPAVMTNDSKEVIR